MLKYRPLSGKPTRFTQEALKGGYLNGGYVKIGFRSALCTRHVNSHCPFEGNSTGKASSRQESAIQTAPRAEKCHSEMNQRVPKSPPNEDRPKSGLRVSVCSFSSLHEAAVWSSVTVAKSMCFSIRMSSSPLKCLLLMVASVVKSPTMIRVTPLVLCGRALWWQLLDE